MTEHLDVGDAFALARAFIGADDAQAQASLLLIYVSHLRVCDECLLQLALFILYENERQKRESTLVLEIERFLTWFRECLGGL